MNQDFALDPRLANDTHLVADWPLSRVLLMDDSRFPWIILVPRRVNVNEWFDLGATDQTLLSREVQAAAAQMKAIFGARKINIGALGNIVAQLHVHVVARFGGDAAWPGPVWGFGQKSLYATDALADLRVRLQGLTAPH